MYFFIFVKKKYYCVRNCYLSPMLKIALYIFKYSPYAELCHKNKNKGIR